MFSKTMSLGKFLADTSTETSLFQLPTIDFNNWELVRSIDSFKQSVTDLNDNAKALFDIAKSIHKYLSNPILIWNGFITLSFWACLVICLSSFIIYLMSDRRKDLDRSKFSFAVWIFIKILDMSIRGI